MVSPHDTSVQALAAYFLANIVHDAQEYVSDWASRTYGKVQVGWSANVGVPVEKYTSDHIDAFRMVLATAWEWAPVVEASPRSLNAIRTKYNELVESVSVSNSDFHAQPEVIAGLHALVAGQRVTHGRRPYAIADIGAGTVDIVAFKLSRDEGRDRTDILEGLVRAHGTGITAQTLDSPKDFRTAEEMLFSTACSAEELPPVTLQHLHGVQSMMAQCMVVSKEKRPDIFCRRSIVGNREERSLQHGSFRDDDVRPVEVYIAGGGAESAIYQDTVCDTYKARALRKCSLPPIELHRFPCPSDFELNSDCSSIQRLCVAYGLSYPDAEFIEYKTQECFGTAYPKEHARRAIPYEDTGDLT